MEFIKVLLIVLLYWIVLAIVPAKKMMNLKIIMYGIFMIVAIAMMFIAEYFMIKLLWISSVNFIGLIIIGLLLVLIVLIAKKYILCAINLIKYYIYKDKIDRVNQIHTGVILKINTLSFSKYDFVHYLTVEFNGKKINSLCFLPGFVNSLYTIGEKIEIKSYKNYNYVILKK